MAQKTQNENPEKPLDYYRRRSQMLRRRYGRKLGDSTWIGGECCIGDGAVLEEHEVGGKTLYVLRYAFRGEPRIIAIYDDAVVASEVARVVHEILHLVHLERRRKRRS